MCEVVHGGGCEGQARLREQFHLIDVREDHEFAEDHAQGARHVGKGVIERDIETVMANIQHKIVLYRDAFRSVLATDVLQ